MLASRGCRRETHVVLSQKTGAELKVVLQVEGTASLELGAESIKRGGLGKVLQAASAAHLPLGVLRDGKTRGSAVAPIGVVVGHGRRLRRMRVVVVV